MTFVYLYLFSVLATVVTLLLSAAAFLYHRRRAREYDRLFQRLPKACWREQLDQEIADAEMKLDSLRDDVHIAQAQIEEARRAKEELERIKQQIEALEPQRREHQRLASELESLRKETDDLRQKRDSMASDLSTAKSQADQLRQQVEGMKAELARGEQSTAALKKQVSELEQKQASIATQISQLEPQLQSKQSQLSDVQKRLDEVRQKLEQESQQLNAVKKEHQKVSTEVQGLQERISHLKKMVEDHQRHLTSLGAPTEEPTEETDSLWKPVLVSDHRKKRSDDEGQALEKTAAYLESLELVFPQRVLWAFHTSLKTADMSPLAVLAGISGTGKSLLPRRYAEGMGMNFLNIAVQPRWDSPQDLFGFYDYLGRRFRATELARALVQMEVFADDPGRGWPERPERDKRGWKSAADRMLLVLLDEMNLARIEYYFSEFLSRLEIRRDVQNDRVKRRAAEIPLELGTRGPMGSIMYIYPGSNVLFVGTMNEDETTQTLSDKVIDRANVLRFGKPKTLRTRQSQAGNTSPDSYLAHQDWHKWCRRPDDHDDEQMKVIQRLNESLSKVNRPFAHRTAMAMRLYVANYPDSSGQGNNRAMADQIEQKILPKLRGLDLKEIRGPLSEVQKIVHELGDQVLEDAIKRASDEKRFHQFMWLGCDRLGEDD